MVRPAEFRIPRFSECWRVALCAVFAALVAGCGSVSEQALGPSGGSATASGSNASGSIGPGVVLSASPARVSSGGSVLLSWSSTNANTCTASGGWSGKQPVSGSISTGPLTGAATYALTCAGPGGSASRSVTVNVSVVAVDGPACTAASGGLTLHALAVRRSGVSPLLVFFDATGTTSSTITDGSTAFQDIAYSWSFGDKAASGTGSWAQGANAGHNGKNAATGAVAAHLYITRGADTTYPVTVTAFDGTNTASCQLAVTAYDPAGARGFPGIQTTCVSNSLVANGCPSGAQLWQAQDIATPLNSTFGSNRRVLFHCGDKFTGSYTIGSGVTTASIGAYGGCEGTTANRPIFQNSAGTTLTFAAHEPTDIRIADIDFEDGSGTAQAISDSGGFGETQITLYNLNCSGMNACYALGQATQSGLIDSSATGMGTSVGTHWNYAANNCLDGSTAAGCGGSGAYYNVGYNALLGNRFDGTGVTGSGGIDTVRISACRFCVVANNSFQNADAVGAVFNLRSGNTLKDQALWIGQYTEYVEISDNLYTGASGAQLAAIAPQTPTNDERLRNIVVERNLFRGVSGGFGRQLLVSAVNATLRDNVFQVTSGDATPPQYGAQVAQRGGEPAPQFVQVYNNTCYAQQAMGSCVGFDGTAFAAAASNSWAANNLFFNPAGNGPTVVDNGSGNSLGGNTINAAADPGMTDASGSFGLIADFAPTQNYAGGSPVPVWYDAVGVAWSPAWALGALKP